MAVFLIIANDLYKVNLYSKSPLRINKMMKGEFMSNYIHFTPEQKEQAHSTDLVSFLRSRGETLKRSGSEYEWKMKER